MADNKTFPFPNKAIEESQKQEQYHLEYAKSIYNLFDTGKTGITRDDRTWMQLMRLYGSGNQPNSIYEDTKVSSKGLTSDNLDEDGVSTAKKKSARVGYNHVNDNNVSLMPRIKNKIKGYVYNIDFDISVDTIDDNSGAEKEDRKAEMMVQMEYGAFLAEAKMKAGVPVDKPMYVPSSPQELELFASVNGFKLNTAKAMEKLLVHSFQLSRWDNYLRDILIDDLIDLGWAATRTYFDCEDYKFKEKYVDPEMLVVPCSKFHDFSEMPWCGYFEKVTIAELRMQRPDVEEADLYALAKKFDGKIGNPALTQWSDFDKRTGDSCGYDDFLVWVLHTEWLDEEHYSKLTYTSRNGRVSRYAITQDESKSLKAKNKDNHVINDYNKRKLRMCSWVVDSDIIYDWGMSTFQERPTKNKVVPSFHIVRLNDKPITELLYPVMDDIKIAWMKFQDGRAMAVKEGYAIDWGMMNNLSDGDKKWSIEEIIKTWRETGILFFQGSLDNRYEGGAVKPAMPMASTGGVMLQEALTMWNFALKKLQDLTGIDPVALGSTDTGSTATEVQLGVNATVDIFRPLVGKLLHLKEICAESLMRRIQLGLRFTQEIADSYSPVVGEDDIRLLMDAEKTHVQYGMSFEAKPDQEYKRALIEAANVSLAQRRQGMVGIDLATHTYLIERIMQGGNLKELRLVLAYQESKHRKELDEQSKQNIMLQGEQNKQLEQVKAQAEQAKLQMEMALKQADLEREILKIYYGQNVDKAGWFAEQFEQRAKTPPSNGQGMPISQRSPQSGSMMPPEGDMQNMEATMA